MKPKSTPVSSKEAIMFRKIPFSPVINDSFQYAHLSAACPPVLSRVCLNDEKEEEESLLLLLCCTGISIPTLYWTYVSS